MGRLAPGPLCSCYRMTIQSRSPCKAPPCRYTLLPPLQPELHAAAAGLSALHYSQQHNALSHHHTVVLVVPWNLCAQTQMAESSGSGAVAPEGTPPDVVTEDAPSPSAASTDAPSASAKREATLEECVSLLRAPKDEQRFVGLLLVTRFLQVPPASAGASWPAADRLHPSPSCRPRLPTIQDRLGVRVALCRLQSPVTSSVCQLVRGPSRRDDIFTGGGWGGREATRKASARCLRRWSTTAPS